MSTEGSGISQRRVSPPRSGLLEPFKAHGVWAPGVRHFYALQFRGMTQQNAALVEQTATAAAALRDQAVGLAAEVSRFKLPTGT